VCDVDVGLTARVHARARNALLRAVDKQRRYAPVISLNFIKFIITERSPIVI